jgi:hypothetical protein
MAPKRKRTGACAGHDDAGGAAGAGSGASTRRAQADAAPLRASGAKPQLPTEAAAHQSSRALAPHAVAPTEAEAAAAAAALLGEWPVALAPLPRGAAAVLSCSKCLRPLGTLAHQLRHIGAEDDVASWPESDDPTADRGPEPVPCENCGEVWLGLYPICQIAIQLNHFTPAQVSYRIQ